MSRPRWLTKIERSILEAAVEDRAPPAGRAPAHMNEVRRRFNGAERKIERLIRRGWIEPPSGFQRYPAEGHLWITDAGRDALEADVREWLLGGTLTIMKGIIIAVLSALTGAAVHAWLGCQ